MTRHLCHVLLGLLVLALGACTRPSQVLPQQSRVMQSQNFSWTRPSVGERWCLSVDPGVPVRRHPGGGAIIGYTRDVVAIYGMQVANYISIVYYTGALGWIELSEVRPYHGRRPDSTCIIEGVDFQQRPIFLIR